MTRNLLAAFAIAAATAMSASVASAQEVHVGPSGVGVGPDHGYRDHYRPRAEADNCHMVITHRRGPDGSVTVRRRVCD